MHAAIDAADRILQAGLVKAVARYSPLIDKTVKAAHHAGEFLRCGIKGETVTKEMAHDAGKGAPHHRVAGKEIREGWRLDAIDGGQQGLPVLVSDGEGRTIRIGEAAGDQVPGAGLNVVVFLFPGANHGIGHGEAEAGDQLGVGLHGGLLVERHINGNLKNLAVGPEGVGPVVGPEESDFRLIGAALQRRCGGVRQAAVEPHFVQLLGIEVEVHIGPALQTVGAEVIGTADHPGGHRSPVGP